MSGLLALVGFLDVDLLLLASLSFLLGSLDFLVTLLGLLIFSSLDLVQAETNDGLLDASSLASAALGDLVNLDLLVEASPCLSPGELDCLLALMEERGNLA